MAVTRRTYLVILAVLLALAAGAAYCRHRVDQAVAACDTPAPPEKPATPPPKLPGFGLGAACGPGESPEAPADPAKKKK